MKKIIFLIFFLNVVRTMDAQEKITSDSLKTVLLRKYMTDYDCSDEVNIKMVGPNSLDKFLRGVFGKVALDNQGYIEAGPAFNISFDNEKALISGNYSKAVKYNQDVVWNIGGKAESDDGTFYFFKKGEFNFNLGIKGGASILLDNNIVYFSTKDEKNVYICQRMQDLRSDTIAKLALEYEMLLSNGYLDSINKKIVATGKLIETKRNNIQLIKPVADMEPLLKEYDKLIELKDKYKELLKESNKKNWSNTITSKGLDAFDKHVIETYATGYRVKWLDVSGEIAYENKKVLDLGDQKDEFVRARSFGRGNLNITFNFYRLTNHALHYLNIGTSLGLAYAYDLLKPKEIEVDSVLGVQNGFIINKPNEKVKAFNPITNPEFDKKFFVAKLVWVYNFFWGPKKFIGIECSGDLGIMGGRKEARYPFNVQGGILFSPVSKNNKLANEGVIGIIVGIQDTNLTDRSSFNLTNFFAGIRVGLPLTPQLTRKEKSE